MTQNEITKNQEKSNGEIVLYQPDDNISIEVRISQDTVWLNRQQLAMLFGRDVKTIGKHINNALKEELSDVATIAKFATVQVEGSRIVNRTMEYYNLDMGHWGRFHLSPCVIIGHNYRYLQFILLSLLYLISGGIPLGIWCQTTDTPCCLI